MKILNSYKEFEEEFLRLQKDYNEYYWAVAWASHDFRSFDELKSNKGKIKKIIIGLNFDGTHPDFIEEFLYDRSVKYIKPEQTKGTFHPKVYLFQNSNSEWELILGSPNFTKAAFTKNDEISILISSKDKNSSKAFLKVKKYINTLWNKGEYIDKNEYEQYKINWKKNLFNTYSKISKLSRSKPAFETEIQKMSWQKFVEKIMRDPNVEGRIATIETVKNLFSDDKRFIDMDIEERKFIAGISNKLDVRREEAKRWKLWKLFGCMDSVIKIPFKPKIAENDENISLALEQIPLSIEITEQHYFDFWKYYEKYYKIVTAGKGSIGAATRLLCMKRPDTFICITSTNKNNLRKAFEISKLSINRDNYWEEIIKKIQSCNWWLDPKPNKDDKGELIISYARAAFLDSFFYEPNKSP